MSRPNFDWVIVVEYPDNDIDLYWFDHDPTAEDWQELRAAWIRFCIELDGDGPDDNEDPAYAADGEQDYLNDHGVFMTLHTSPNADPADQPPNRGDE